ncbi:hypothetical protein MiSe_93240 [Microseira wollei NIES-4236]|uniref:Uncharacterized protein n=1 Tax=Microseira wollei NIES-4236 TaxID=2530354 RepID=A0AAV3XPL2_9CYAN|nr:hypothetical protein MiSe_93240 [Microseira wollei NIES-4236]
MGVDRRHPGLQRLKPRSPVVTKGYMLSSRVR